MASIVCLRCGGDRLVGGTILPTAKRVTVTAKRDWKSFHVLIWVAASGWTVSTVLAWVLWWYL
jgi:hypothetical protein